MIGTMDTSPVEFHLPLAPLVFIHGAGSNRAFWHEQYAAFPTAHYLNLPGHSDLRDHPGTGDVMTSVEQYADWVGRFVEEQAPGGVLLNGHSMGGAIVLTLALRRPAWLRGIVLTGTGARLRVSPDLLHLLRTDYPAAVDLIVERSFAAQSGAPTYAERARLNGIRRQLLRTPQEVTLADYEACDRFDVMSRLGEIDVPTLIFSGAQDSMTPPSYSAYLHRHIANSRLCVIENAGHMLPLEQPGEYNRVLKENQIS